MLLSEWKVIKVGQVLLKTILFSKLFFPYTYFAASSNINLYLSYVNTFLKRLKTGTFWELAISEPRGASFFSSIGFQCTSFLGFDWTLVEASFKVRLWIISNWMFQRIIFLCRSDILFIKILQELILNLFG